MTFFVKTFMNIIPYIPFDLNDSGINAVESKNVQS